MNKAILKEKIIFTEYIEAVLSIAKYEIIKDEEPYYGEISRLKGIWGQQAKLWRDVVKILKKSSKSGSWLD